MVNLNGSNSEEQDVRWRLLQAGEELFAGKGFMATSVRDLTAKAQCNLAAVNYHFGGKEGLYCEVFRERLRQMREKRLESIEQAIHGRENPTLEDLLRTYAKAFLEPFADRGSSERFIQLVVREMLDQRLPKRMFIQDMAGPVMAALEEAVRVLCPYLGEAEARIVGHLFVAQLVHLIRMKVLFESDAGAAEMAFDVERAVEHIVSFSAAGIRSYKKERGQ